ncbi:hypothetical protein AgCh_033826 [Apium graveolens]
MISLQGLAAHAHLDKKTRLRWGDSYLRGNKASTSRSFLAKLQRGWVVHFIDLTSLYLRLKRGVGRAVKAHLVHSEQAASTYSDQNEKQQAELEEASLYQRKPLL